MYLEIYQAGCKVRVESSNGCQELLFEAGPVYLGHHSRETLLSMLFFPKLAGIPR